MTTSSHMITGGPPRRRLAARLTDATSALRDCEAIGPVGTLARVALGLGLLYLALVWDDARWGDAVLGLVVMPAVTVGLAALRARRSRRPLRAVGPLAHALNAAAIVLLFVLPATGEAAFLFYGVSMLVGAARRTGGCEVTAISNAVLDRDDQVGCVFFAPLDLAEQRLRRSA